MRRPPDSTNQALHCTAARTWATSAKACSYQKPVSCCGLKLELTELERIARRSGHPASASVVSSRGSASSRNMAGQQLVKGPDRRSAGHKSQAQQRPENLDLDLAVKFRFDESCVLILQQRHTFSSTVFDSHRSAFPRSDEMLTSRHLLLAAPSCFSWWIVGRGSSNQRRPSRRQSGRQRRDCLPPPSIRRSPSRPTALQTTEPTHPLDEDTQGVLRHIQRTRFDAFSVGVKGGTCMSPTGPCEV